MRSMRHDSQKWISGEMNSHTPKSTIHENNDVKNENESSQIRHESHKEASREIISHTPKSTTHENNDAKDENESSQITDNVTSDAEESVGYKGTVILKQQIFFQMIFCFIV